MKSALHRLLAVSLFAVSACASPSAVDANAGGNSHDLGGFISAPDMTIALAKADLSASSDDLATTSTDLATVKTDLAMAKTDFATAPQDFAVKPADMATASGCGSVTYAGSCNGNVVTYCYNNMVKMVTCASPTRCTVAGGDANCRYVAGDPCGNVTYDGLCSGDTLVYCNASKLVVTDCTAAPSNSFCTTSGTLAYCF